MKAKLDYQQHIILALFLAFGLDKLTFDFTPIETLAYYSLIAFGSILPDADHPKSFIGSKIHPFSDIIYKLVGHRNLTHSLVFLTFILIITIILQKSNIITLSIIIGMAMHIAGDMLTPQGCALLYPLRKKRYKIKQ